MSNSQKPPQVTNENLLPEEEVPLLGGLPQSMASVAPLKKKKSKGKKRSKKKGQAGNDEDEDNNNRETSAESRGPNPSLYAIMEE